MVSREMTSENFMSLIESGTVVVEWWAPWCGPCRELRPVFAAAAERHPGAVFLQVNIEDEAGLAAAFTVRALPTVMVFRDGILMSAEPGMTSSQGLDELLAEVATIDMDELRQRIDAAEARERASTTTQHSISIKEEELKS